MRGSLHLLDRQPAESARTHEPWTWILVVGCQNGLGPHYSEFHGSQINDLGDLSWNFVWFFFAHFPIPHLLLPDVNGIHPNPKQLENCLPFLITCFALFWTLKPNNE